MLGAGAVILLPPAIPWLVTTIGGFAIAKRHAFWITYRWQWAVNTVGVVVVAVVIAYEAVQIAEWVGSGAAKALLDTDRWWETLWAGAWPWLLLNLALGLLLLPVAWWIRRRRIAEMVRRRTIPDVLTQEHIESARKRAADLASARRLGVQLDPRTGALSAGKGTSIDAPAGAIALISRMTTRLRGRDKSPGVVFVDEFAQLVTADSDPGDTAGSMFETARSAGLGLWLAVQSVAGISNDETRRERALSSGAALIFGRSKAPESVVSYAGTVMRLESSGAATLDELRSARAQHTYVVPPQDVRQATVGQFWLVQSGGLISGRALPPRSPATPPQ